MPPPTNFTFSQIPEAVLCSFPSTATRQLPPPQDLPTLSQVTLTSPNSQGPPQIPSHLPPTQVLRHFCIPNLLNHIPGWSPKYGHPEMVAPPTLVPLVAPNPGGSPCRKGCFISSPYLQVVALKWQTSLTPHPLKLGTVTPNPLALFPLGTMIAVSSTPRSSKFGTSPRWQLPHHPDFPKPGGSHLQHCCHPPHVPQISPRCSAIPSCP